MSFLGCCGSGISPDIIIYFHLLHNQGGRFKIVSKIGQVLCVLLFINGFMSSVLIVILIFLGSMANSGFHESMFHHYVASPECLIILAFCLCLSLYHHNHFTIVYLFRPIFSSVSIAVLIITAVFSMIESIESTNRAFPEVFVLRPTI
jgi:uncharacterized membrane protein